MSASEESQTGDLGNIPTPQPQLQTTSSAHDSAEAQSCLDPRGDLCLEIGLHPAKSFRVCSRTVARASPFFDKLLYGDFKESKKLCPQNGNLGWAVKLPEDDPTVMELLLSICHGQFDVVARYNKGLNVKSLYDISIVTDKYDMAHVLQPWARDWLQSTLSSNNPKSSEYLRGKLCHERLWISWALGDRSEFQEIAKIMLLKSCTLRSHPNYLRYAEVLEPPEIYGQFDHQHPSSHV